MNESEGQWGATAECCVFQPHGLGLCDMSRLPLSLKDAEELHKTLHCSYCRDIAENAVL